MLTLVQLQDSIEGSFGIEGIETSFKQQHVCTTFY